VSVRVGNTKTIPEPDRGGHHSDLTEIASLFLNGFAALINTKVIGPRLDSGAKSSATRDRAPREDDPQTSRALIGSKVENGVSDGTQTLDGCRSFAYRHCSGSRSRHRLRLARRTELARRRLAWWLGMASRLLLGSRLGRAHWLVRLGSRLGVESGLGLDSRLRLDLALGWGPMSRRDWRVDWWCGPRVPDR
jgi:hypothetical protein